jgi:hypothetical protein
MFALKELKPPVFPGAFSFFIEQIFSFYTKIQKHYICAN